MPAQPQLPDRRPIKARETRWARAVTDALIRLRVSPQSISASTMVFGALGAVAFAATTHVESHAATAALFIAAALCMQLRLLANLFDGMVALGNGKPLNPTGALWNEVPDRVADACFCIGAGYALGGSVMLGWLAAVAAVFTAYVRAQGVAVGARNDFCGPMAKPHRMALMTATALICAALPPRMLHLIGTAPLAPGMYFRDLSFGTLISGGLISGGLIAGALALMVLGCVVTCARRLQHIKADLKHTRRHSV